MEQIFLRFPHLAEGIFEKLNNKTLANCKVVSRSWKASIDDFKFTWIRALKNSSKDSLIRMLKSELDRDKVKSIAIGTQELDLKKKEETVKRLLKVRNAQLSQNVKYVELLTERGCVLITQQNLRKFEFFLLCTFKNSNFRKFCWVIRTQPMF